MNEKFQNSIKKAGEEISLTHDERARMRRTLHAYMEMKPARVQRAGGPLRTPSSFLLPAFGRFFTFRPIAATLVLTLFISSSGISYAAEDALPGDILYPVKTHVNEPVRGALALSATAKASWAAAVAGTRVQEAATLAAEGRLTRSTQQELQADFEQHAKQATEVIAEIASSSPDTSTEAAVRFEAQLSEYENVLAQIGAAKHVDVTSLASSIQNERGHIAAIRIQTESSDADRSAAGRMGVAARAQLDTSVRLARAVSESLSSSSADIVAAQLDDASTSISAGEDFASHNAGSDAIDAFQNALSATEKIGVFLNTSSAIHARTGIVVGEPRKSNRGSNNGGEGATQGIRAAAAVNTSATSSGTARPFETTPDTGSKTQSGDEQGKTENSGEQTLPVSVPVHLPF